MLEGIRSWGRRQAFKAAASLAGVDIRPRAAIWTPGQAQWTTWAWHTNAKDGYQQNPYLYRMDLVKPQRKYTIGRAAKHSQPGMLPSDFPLDRSLMKISKSSVSCLDCVPLG